MVRLQFICLLGFLFFWCSSFSQNKAIVLENIWSNDLNNYSPQEFLDKMFMTLKEKLAVKDFIADSKILTAARKDENRDKNVKEFIKAKRLLGDAYFVSIASELRLPAFNLGKFLFKNPPRSSKLTFTMHVYDTTGTEVIGDTIINRGCIVRTVDEDKGNKYFYSDYSNFMADMLCHFEAIRKILQEKKLLRKQRRYQETK